MIEEIRGTKLQNIMEEYFNLHVGLFVFVSACGSEKLYYLIII